MNAVRSVQLRLRSRLAGGLVLGAAVMMVGCGGPADSPPVLPAALVLRIDAVEVGSRVGSGSSWDGPEAEEEAGVGCRVLVAGLTLVEPAASPLAAVCGWAKGEQKERRAEAPDLLVRLGVGADVAYTTWVEPDTTSQSLQYEVVLPIAAIPADGLRVEVLDDDREQGVELIGGMRISRQELTNAYRSGSKLLVLSDGAVRRLEVVVSGYGAVEAVELRRRASDGPAKLRPAARAGEVVSVRASGKFKVGSWFDETLTPAGYPGGDARSYNLRSFEKQPHACAIALISTGRNIEGEVIGLERTFVAKHAGALSVGLNDKDLSNNEGQVSYRVTRRAPTADEWLRAGRSR